MPAAAGSEVRVVGLRFVANRPLLCCARLLNGAKKAPISPEGRQLGFDPGSLHPGSLHILH
jgi:hypothetical protein